MSPEDKICLQQDLADRLATLPRPLVINNSLFDVLRRGHLSNLHRATKLGTRTEYVPIRLAA